MAGAKTSIVTRGLHAGGLVAASAALFHLFAVYGGNHGCVETACHIDLSNAPSVRSKSSAGNVTFLGVFPTIVQCESACLAFKV